MPGDPGANGYGSLSLRLGRTSKVFTRLSSKDIKVIARAQQALSE